MTMGPLDIDALRTQVRAMDYVRCTPEAVAQWRKDYADSRANLIIEDMLPDDEDEALFAMMLDEGLPPSLMVQVIQSIYAPCAIASAPDRVAGL